MRTPTRRGLAVIGLVVLAGCRQLLGFDDPAPLAKDGPEDGPGDVSSETTPIDGCTTFSTVIDTCVTAATDPLQISGGASTYNSDTFLLTTPGGTTTPQHVVLSTASGPVVAVFATDITIDNAVTLTLTGTRMVALIAPGTIKIDGEVVVSPGALGALAASTCGTGAGGKGSNDGGGGSGGGGGAFQGNGGGGGNGDNDGGQSTGASQGLAVARPVNLRGGCPGGDGGNGIGQGGKGADGGGALLIASATSIRITGFILAGGGGGKGGKIPSGGGGGGGSGGMLIFEAPSFTVTGTGVVFAEGGGGGEGAGAGVGLNGNDGGVFDVLGNVGAGGAGNAGTGADGGNGSTALDGVTPTQVLNDGGGGGGGAAGFIAVRATTIDTAGSLIGPPSMPWP